MKTLIEYSREVDLKKLEAEATKDAEKYGTSFQEELAIIKEAKQVTALKHGLEDACKGSELVKSDKNRFQSYWNLNLSDEVAQAIKEFGFSGFQAKVADTVLSTKKMSEKQFDILCKQIFPNHKFS